MYCPKCGATNDDQASFCHQCGADLRSSKQEPNQVAQGIMIVTTYAGFWKRLAAFLIDYLIVCAVSVILIFTPVFFPFLLAIVGGWLYFALMESSEKQATLGKMALGIVVTDMEGRRVTFGKATGRFFGKMLSIILCIGFIMVAFTEKKQGLHDILANTLVVNKQ